MNYDSACGRKAHGKQGKSKQKLTKTLRKSPNLLHLSTTSESDPSASPLVQIPSRFKSQSRPVSGMSSYSGIKSSTLKREYESDKTKDLLLMDSSCVVTPPATFNDFYSTLSSPIIVNNHETTFPSLNSLSSHATKQTNKDQTKKVRMRHNSLSSVSSLKYMQSVFTEPYKSCKCNCTNQDSSMEALRSQIETESDLSSIALPPLCASLQRTLSETGACFETSSHHSTTL